MRSHSANHSLLFAILIVALLGSSAPSSVRAIETSALDVPSADSAAPSTVTGGENDWAMLAANPERTSWTPEEVSGALQPTWYRTIEPYINYKTQVIAAHGLLYISTAAGLYALSAENGEVAWVYPTDMPLGHSPTVVGDTLYVGGLDRKTHAIAAAPDLASLPVQDGFRVNDQVLWTFTAEGGFETNPLVMDGRLYAGNRDGYLYALDAASGALLWKYDMGAPISFSAAYCEGVVFTATTDGYAYAVRVDGSLLWRSEKLPGSGFYSYWPVIYRDYVIFAGSTAYGFTSGLSVGQLNNRLDRAAVYPQSARSTPIGTVGHEPGDWVTGTYTIVDSRATEYYEQMPWRRTYFVLSRATGEEYTFDSDGDGLAEYAPMLWTGTHSGNRYPPIVGGDGVLYQQQSYLSDPYIPGGQVSGWEFGTSLVSQVSADWQAVDEPQAYSAGGGLVYWTNCSDREAGAFDVTVPLGNPDREWKYYDYSLGSRAPGYWISYSGPYEIGGWGLRGTYGGSNGVYGNHGTQNPPIPYNGRLFKIAGNAVLALGPTLEEGALETVPTVSSTSVVTTTAITKDEVLQRLEEEVSKMIAAGHLRPGYHNAGLEDNILGHDSNSYLTQYFHNPAETFYTLIRALPYLSADLRAQTRRYLQQEYADYGEVAHIGWQQGASREGDTVPPEVQERMAAFAPQMDIYGSYWDERYRVYGLWKYAEEFGGARAIYASIKGKMPIVNPANDSMYAPTTPTYHYQTYLPMATSSPTWLTSTVQASVLISNTIEAAQPGTYAYQPYIMNAYIAGYMGYLGIEALAGEPETTVIRTELDRLLRLRAGAFSTNSPFGAYSTYHNALNVARNFMFMVPELADYLRGHAYARVEQAVNAYSDVAPYWFVAGYDATYGEGASQQLFDPVALFQAKALVLQEPYEELAQYLDVPAFEVGDLYYIQNLVALLEADSQGDDSLTAPDHPHNPRVPGAASLSADAPRISTPQVLSAEPIGTYEKFEIAFTVETTATNPYFPYDADPPAGVDPGAGITVDVLVLAPGRTDWQEATSVPAFYYQPVEEAGTGDNAALLPTGPPEWRARYSPPTAGTWQYRVRVADAAGVSESAVQSFTVVESESRGFLGVSTTDSRFFAFSDGTAFTTPLVNVEEGSPFNSLASIRSSLSLLGENGIRFVRWFPTGEGANYAVVPFGDDLRSAWSFGDSWSTLNGVDSAAGKEISFSPYYYSAQALPGEAGTRYRLTFRAQVTGERVLRAGIGGLGEIDICATANTQHSANSQGDTCDCRADGWNDYELVLTNASAANLEAYVRGLYVSADAPSPYNAVQTGSIRLHALSLQQDQTGQGDWGPNLLTRSDPETDLYVDQRSAALLDEILTLSEQQGVYHKLTLFHKNDVVLNWMQPDGSIAADIGTYNSHFYAADGQAARWYEYAYVRYFLARWSYSPALHSVELANENSLRADSYDAGLDLAAYVHAVSPRFLLVSNSFWGYFAEPFFTDPARGDLIDYGDQHWYANQVSTNGQVISTIWDDSAAYVRECTRRFQAYRAAYGYDKPIVRGEGGVAAAGTQPQLADIARDPSGTYYHKKLWAHVGALGDSCDGEWYPKLFGSATSDLAGMFAAYERFMQGEPFANGGYEAIGTDLTDTAEVLLDTEAGALRAWGSRDALAGRALLWIDNANHTWKHVVDGATIPPAGGTLTVQELPAGAYRVAWWDTATGSISLTTTHTVASDGRLALAVSGLEGDVAVKIVRTGDLGPIDYHWKTYLPAVTLS
ncbi:MAG: outer membrane protein assembly factor BamB family protein [Anaerolineae bacterium]